MSMLIRHPLKGHPALLCSQPMNPAKADSVAAPLESARTRCLVAVVFASIQRSLFAGIARLRPELQGHEERSERARRLFQDWAASDFAYRDVASQIWPTFMPN
jgi:hypothetical protein